MLYYDVFFTYFDRENNLDEIGGGCIFAPRGELAQLARALAWHARGHRFDSGILHIMSTARVRSNEAEGLSFGFVFS
jgi:hypothetical protein